ncbi:MAG: D-alanine--D-alanine ligase, partial [Bacteroidota bacterium]
MRVGIFFGGPSREREISFAGGRTVYDNLNKSLFEALPIFVDSFKNLILLDWEYIYKGSIRDFYPPVSVLPESPNAFQVYVESLGKMDKHQLDMVISKVGRKIEPSLLLELIDFAFLALHGVYGEDGQIQGLMESLAIPYSGSGIRACSIGMDKSFQKQLMANGGFASPEVIVIKREAWESNNDFYERSIQQIGLPCVIRPANQGSSIGVSILKEGTNEESFKAAVDNAFFRKYISKEFWESVNTEQRTEYIKDLSDIRSGLGFPLDVN